MAGRRPNGDGTIKKRANGIYEGRLTLSDGTRKSIYGKKLDHVRRQLDAAKHDRDKGLPVLHGKCQTVASFLATWLELKKVTRSYRTWKGYEELIRNHIEPTFGKLPLTKLTAQHG